MTVEYTDEKGILQKITRMFTVLAAGEADGLPAFTATPAATISPTKIATRSSMPATESGILDVGVLTPTYVLSIVGLGLFVFGFLLRNKLNRIS